MNPLSDHLDLDFYNTRYGLSLNLTEALNHYLTEGWRLGFNPSSNFDSASWYAVESGLIYPDRAPLLDFYQRVLNASASADPGRFSGWESDRADALHELISADGTFDPDYYSKRYEDVAGSGLTPLQHYISFGAREDRIPSSNFDPVYYRLMYMDGRLGSMVSFEHYLRFGKHRGALRNGEEASSAVRVISVSTPKLRGSAVMRIVDYIIIRHLFDSSYYLNRYEDVRAAGIDPLHHYLAYGASEMRAMSGDMDPHFYTSQYAPDDRQAAGLHYAVFGFPMGLPSSPVSQHVKARRAIDQVWYDKAMALVSMLGFQADIYGRGDTARLASEMFSAASYRQSKALPGSTSDIECLLRYLVFDHKGDTNPGPMFSERWLETQGFRFDHASGASRFDQWVAVPKVRALSPWPFFDITDYETINPDLATYPESSFLHFVKHGIDEGRRFSSILQFNEGRIAKGIGANASQVRRFADQMGLDERGSDEYLSMKNFMDSGLLETFIGAARDIDPAVGEISTYTPSYVAPWHDGDYTDYKSLVDLIGDDRYDNVILVPFCKMGGADYVAGVLSKTLAEVGSVLVIQTDQSEWFRDQWYSKHARKLDLSSHLEFLDEKIRRRVIYELLVRLRPRAVYNVNSRLAFDTFVEYGGRLSNVTDLHAYYFCAERTKSGIEVGYPVSYFANVFPHLKSAIFDSATLADQISHRYALSGNDRQRVKVAYTPKATDRDGAIVEEQISEIAAGGRPMILWAGRFDRQKRFDLLVGCAASMPDVDFHAWGKAVLDQTELKADLPPNLTVHPPYDEISDLPLAKASGWLYTSDWDGIPTILIDLAVRGMPIVASTSGGVGELVTDETGWPIKPGSPVSAYVDAIESMLGSGDDRVGRALKLQARAREQHSHESYRAALGLNNAREDHAEA